MNVLFITSSRLGDAVLSTGLLDHIIQENPDAKITVVCGVLPARIFQGIPAVEDVIVLKKQKWNRHWFGLWKRVRKKRWDMVADLRNSLVSRLIPAQKRYIYTGAIDRSLHKVEQNAAVMKLSEPPAPKLWITAEQEKQAAQFIPDGGPVLGIGPTANWQAKTWPVESFIELIAILTAADGILPGARIAVFAAPGEEKAAYEVLHSVSAERQIDIIAKADPGTVAAALARCALYIGNDSGLMHCAAAAGTPTVGLFGPSWPHLYRPWGGRTAYAETLETFSELIDYEGYTPSTAPCLMNSLTVEAVVERVRGFWMAEE